MADSYYYARGFRVRGRYESVSQNQEFPFAGSALLWDGMVAEPLFTKRRFKGARSKGIPHLQKLMVAVILNIAPRSGGISFTIRLMLYRQTPQQSSNTACSCCIFSGALDRWSYGLLVYVKKT